MLPRPDFRDSDIGPDPDAWLAQREDRVPGLPADRRKRIIWAGAPGQVTPLSIVYIHGWSACSEELRPVPDFVAQALGANLHFTRLTGHGLDGAALAAAREGDWMRDGAEAVAIGRRIGRRVILFGTSTGATIATALALDPMRNDRVAGVAMVSPNFRIAGAGAPLLTLPGARWLVPIIAGRVTDAPGHDTRHEEYWTRTYPTRAVLPLARLVRQVRALDFRAARVPALFIYTLQDNVVRQSETVRIADQWGAPVHRMTPHVPPDEMHGVHVLGGDILSPGRTRPIADKVIAWIRDITGPNSG
jgi:alpha-beta hydrolase superfamily lysophospholipase